MKQKGFIILVITIVVIGGVIGGAFAGGIAIGKSQGQEAVDEDMQSRLEQFASRFGQGGGAQEGMPQQGSQLPGGFAGRGGTMGTVEKIEGNVVTITTMRGATIRVLISDSTAIQKMAEGELADVLPGASVTVSGEQQEDGSIKATSIFMTPELRTE